MTISCKLLGGFKEQHSEPIYCVAWSNDLHIIDYYDDDIDQQQKQHGNAGNDVREHDVQCHRVIKNDEQTKPTSGDEKNSQSEHNSENECNERQRKSKLCRYMATCGSNYLTIYEVDEINSKSKSKYKLKSGCGMRPRQAYVDVNKKEVFYSCVFVGNGVGSDYGYKASEMNLHQQHGDNKSNYHSNRKRKRDKGNYERFDFSSYDGPQLCCVGGTSGIIKVIDTVRMSLLLTLSGHGNEIYDMSVCPTNKWLLLSASKDESLRLWNIKHAQCLAIFAGHEGHRDGVLSVDWHPLGEMFVSGGMDETIKIWSITSDEIQQTMESDKNDDNESLRIVYQQLPLFSSSMLHTNYVDCVQFVGDLILSKSTTNVIALWKPDLSTSKTTANCFAPTKCNDTFLHLADYDCNSCDVWYVRFGKNKECNMLAIGNKTGDLRLFHIDTRTYYNFATFNTSSTVRQVSFSPDSSTLIAVCDDSTVWRWLIEYDDQSDSSSSILD